MDTEVQTAEHIALSSKPLGNLVEALTALELTSEASRIHLDTAVPNIRELRKLNRSAQRDVELIVRLVKQIRRSSDGLATLQSAVV